MENSKSRLENLSGIGCLLLTAIACFVSITTKSYSIHAVFVVWLTIVFIYFGFFKQGLIYLAIYVFTTAWLLIAVPKGIYFFSPMLLGMIYKYIVPIMSAYLTFKIPSGKIIAVFQKCYMPKNVLIIIIIILRFIPTISNEIKAIWEAMHVRGFVTKKRQIVLYPLKFMEYVMVPLIFRSIKVADELAAAAIVRGIENTGKKQSYYSIKPTPTDITILLISSLICILGII